VLDRRFILVLILLVASAAPLAGAPRGGVPDLSKYEGRTVASVEVVYEGAARDATAEADLRRLLTIAPNTTFSAVRVRESLQALFDSGRVENARVEAAAAPGGAAPGGVDPVALRFFVRPQVRVTDVRLELGPTLPDAPVTADELRARLNLLDPGARVSEQSLRAGADAIQVYLRDRGFFRADVTFTRTIDAAGTGAIVVYQVNPGEQARVEAFNIKVTGFDDASVRPSLRLAPDAPFTRTALGEDLGRIRRAIMEQGYLAPQLSEPQTVIDATRNTITINLTGGIGPRVNVEVTNYEVGDKKRRELLPVRREGSIDQAAIEEGARRLKNYLQEQGYFFANVTATCAVDRPAPAAAATTTDSAAPAADANATVADAGALAVAADPTAQTTQSPLVQPGVCDNLNPLELSGRTVNINYDVERGRRFKLTEIRIEGTEKLSYEDLADQLRSEPSSALALIPFLGSGRGYTSVELLSRDRETVRARMRDLGYRRAVVEVRQGVQIDSENLIITFAVTEGPLTRVAGVEVRGNQLYTAERLRNEPCAAASQRSEPCTIIEGPFARTLARADGERIRSLYARNGYIDADVRVDIVELPRKGGDEQVRLVYNITEGGKVFINRIIINGNEGTRPDAQMRTKREAILEAIPLREGEVLRSDNLAEAERVLYETNAFRQVIIRTESAGETASGFRRSDVIIDLEENRPNRLDYGGGFSTDAGPLGLFELRNNNLFGGLRQAALRTRASRRQQLLRLEYFDPRFAPTASRNFRRSPSPPSTSATSTSRVSSARPLIAVTSASSSGLDEEGNPIDEFGESTGRADHQPLHLQHRIAARHPAAFAHDPLSALQLRRRAPAQHRQPARRSRTPTGSRRAPVALRAQRSRATRATASSTRRAASSSPSTTPSRSGNSAAISRSPKCSPPIAAISDSAAAPIRRSSRTGAGAACSAGLTSSVRGTVFAVNLNLGLANLFNPRDRDGDNVIDDVDRTLPISERFFAGGSTSLRGFGFEEAGPRLSICPSGTNDSSLLDVRNCTGGVFRNRQGDPITLNPFTVPIGGNAMAVVNLEARVPLTKTFQIVPFYDGGNVFRRVGDIFGRNDRRPGDSPNTNNLRVEWTHTAGLGLRVKTPIGALGVDYGLLLNPPEFELPQAFGAPAIIRPRRAQIHFRFGQAF
jgi:outer membrane protein insertion porin family